MDHQLTKTQKTLKRLSSQNTGMLFERNILYNTMTELVFSYSSDTIFEVYYGSNPQDLDYMINIFLCERTSCPCRPLGNQTISALLHLSPDLSPVSIFIHVWDLFVFGCFPFRSQEGQMALPSVLFISEYNIQKYTCVHLYNDLPINTGISRFFYLGIPGKVSIDYKAISIDETSATVPYSLPSVLCRHRIYWDTENVTYPGAYRGGGGEGGLGRPTPTQTYTGRPKLKP